MENALYFSPEDLERYAEKQMTPAEMHDFETALLVHPYLAESLEGYKLMKKHKELKAQEQKVKVPDHK
jgi:hypothetical protein